MTQNVTTLPQPEFDLRGLLDALAGFEGRPLAMDYAGRRTRPGYHVTEIKAGSYAALDCGGNPDSWTEILFQVEDMEGQDDPRTMTVGKFVAILGRVAATLSLDPTSRVTFEVGGPEEAMQVFDLASVSAGNDRVILALAARPAICKPRHRANIQASSCCGANTNMAACGPRAAAACCA